MIYLFLYSKFKERNRNHY